MITESPGSGLGRIGCRLESGGEEAPAYPQAPPERVAMAGPV
jgi:hypothetical protein